MNKTIQFAFFPGGNGNNWIDHTADGLMGWMAMFLTDASRMWIIKYAET